MTQEKLRLTVAACAVTVSIVFCLLGSIKIKNDSSIAADTNRIADALEAMLIPSCSDSNTIGPCRPARLVIPE